MNNITVRNARTDEFTDIGKLLVGVYSQLDGFPKPHEQPKYYELLSNVGALTDKSGTEILVATEGSKLVGAVVYFADMKYYGSGGIATQETNTSGFRLLAVDPVARGSGIGKILTQTCLDKARRKGHRQMIIHTTMAMQTAWNMYERIGFKRSPELDFMQGDLAVYGFRFTF
jgi:GNAT superfamily N-acetyltransferase